jgi:Na+/H+ antiporter NhaD/arsenite permease-like protein
MVTTFTLSGWIAINTSVVAMMIPIVSGLVDNLDSSEVTQRLRMLYMLAVGYAANIGGTAVMIGSVPNLILRDLVAL